MVYVNAHRKAILAFIAAMLVIFLPADQAKEISAVVGAIFTALVPNDQEAIERVYRKPRHGRR